MAAAPKGTARRDMMLALQDKAQGKWDKVRAFTPPAVAMGARTHTRGNILPPSEKKEKERQRRRAFFFAHGRNAIRALPLVTKGPAC